MIISSIILAAYGILFAISKGTFSAGAKYIISKLHVSLPFDEAVLSYALAALFISAAASLLFSVSAKMNDTVSEGYLLRNGYGQPGRTESLNVSVDDDKYPVDIEVAERLYTEAEVGELLSDAGSKLKDILEYDYDINRIENDIPLETLLGDSPVGLSWITYSPDILDWDGKIGDDVPEKGTVIKAEATLSLQGRELTETFFFTVYPKKLPVKDATVKRIKDRINEENPETQEKIILPSEIDGKSLSWSSSSDRTAVIILIAGVLAAFLISVAGIRSGSDEANKIKEAMMADYPNIIDKLVLLLNAGLSTRLAVKRIALDYKKNSVPGKKVRWGYEEIYRTYTEMEMGIPERDAYINMGKRAAVPKYKALSTLLVQNLLRGSRELIGILEEEAANAFEDRKKRAKIAGEKAGTKLLFPMLMMLGIVLIILIVPAFMNFI